MIPVLLQFSASALAIVLAGGLLTKFADRIADETGMGRILVGSILLAGATSLPELMVDINAVLLDQPDLAVGDLLGSSLFNLFILAIVDLVFRHPRRAFSNDFAHHAQAAVLSINLTGLVGIGILSRTSFTLAGVGVFTWMVGIAYLIGARLIFIHHDASSDLKPPESQVSSQKGALARAVLGFVGSAIVILAAAPFLVRAADQIAASSGLGHTFIGTTLVALSTSLPELVATIAAFRMGAPDLALGNIFGSNTFNMLLLFPLDALYPGALLGSVHPTHALTAFCVIVVSSIAVFGQISRKREKVRIWEPSSQLIVVLILGFLYLLFRSGTVSG